MCWAESESCGYVDLNVLERFIMVPKEGAMQDGRSEPARCSRGGERGIRRFTMRPVFSLVDEWADCEAQAEAQEKVVVVIVGKWRPANIAHSGVRPAKNTAAIVHTDGHCLMRKSRSGRRDPGVAGHTRTRMGPNELIAGGYRHKRVEQDASGNPAVGRWQGAIQCGEGLADGGGKGTNHQRNTRG